MKRLTVFLCAITLFGCATGKVAILQNESGQVVRCDTNNRSPGSVGYGNFGLVFSNTGMYYDCIRQYEELGYSSGMGYDSGYYYYLSRFAKQDCGRFTQPDANKQCEVQTEKARERVNLKYAHIAERGCSGVKGFSNLQKCRAEVGEARDILGFKR